MGRLDELDLSLTLKRSEEERGCRERGFPLPDPSDLEAAEP
jgi:hypothetical protein